MRGPILASLVLLWPLAAPEGSAAEPHHRNRTWCDGSGTCYSVHLSEAPFQRAKAACAQYGGGLSTASGREELQAILALLRGVASGGGSGAGLFWLGLVRKAPQCTREDLPLRGFSWAAVGSPESPANETSETPAWVREPVKSCTTRRCAGLSVTLGQPLLEPWGLVEQACGAASPGYICKYRHRGACAALLPTSGARRLSLTLPSRLQSPAGEFSPPGTILSLNCSSGQEARFVCHPSPDGYHWEGAGHDLCSCPSGLWSPTEGACAALGDCRGAPGAFLCLCAWGARLEATEEACVGGQRAGEAVTATATPGLSVAATRGALSPNSTTGRPAQNSSWEPFPSDAGNGTEAGAETPLTFSDSSNYVFILVTVAVVLLVILVMAALQVFQACFRVCSPSKRAQAEKDRAPAAAGEGDLDGSASRTHSEHSLGPSKAESGDVSRDDPTPGDGPVERGLP